jgi:hypothetical protein
MLCEQHTTKMWQRSFASKNGEVTSQYSVCEKADVVNFRRRSTV